RAWRPSAGRRSRRSARAPAPAATRAARTSRSACAHDSATMWCATAGATCGCAQNARWSGRVSCPSPSPASAPSARRSGTSRTVATTASPDARGWWGFVLDPGIVRSNLAAVRERVGPDVEILAATKYVEADDLPALAEAGVELVGENRSDALLAKQER